MTSIQLKNVSVEFPIYNTPSRSLKNRVLNFATGGKIERKSDRLVIVSGLDDISLTFRDGERIGLIGNNGSGKTTLLRVLSGIYKPVAGKIIIDGSVGTLLDPSAGMDHEATGRENIYLRGHLLGMSNKEIDDSIDDIARFTDLGDFLELPMKTYSAAMSARLAFGISTAMKNDILLIDEGIGAGDATFQAKANARIQRLFEETSIVILASHSPDIIRTFCTKTIVMQQGKIASIS